MSEFPILSYLIIIPLLGILTIWFNFLFLKKNSPSLAKNSALFASIVNFILSIILIYNFNPDYPHLQFVEIRNWFPSLNIYYSLGIDGISVYFILLTALLIPICILASWKVIKTKIEIYMSLFLLMETFVIGVFSATDLFLFYIFFEAVLIPMFLIIGIWGGEDRVYAALKFFLYTLFGSLFMLIAIIYIYYNEGYTNIQTLAANLAHYPLKIQKWLWLAFFISFAIKVPMWPFHTWLPYAHVQAPTAGSVILAGILLKMGGYGFLRFSIPMFPDASLYFSNFIFYLSIIAVIYTSIVALMQTDMKKLIAYSSVAHMGYVTAGIFSMNMQGIQGSIFQMVSHGLVSAGLFLCVGVLYDRMHTKKISYYQGVVTKMPKFSALFMIFVLASLGLPGTSGFIGEFMILIGIFKVNHIYASLMALGMVFGAAYILWLFTRIIFGKLNKNLSNLNDLTHTEKLNLTVITILVISIGIFPTIINKYTVTTTLNIEKALKNVHYDKITTTKKQSDKDIDLKYEFNNKD